MAEAEAGGLTDVIAEIELSMPLVPHVALSSEELDRLYPPFTAPKELDNPDLDDQSSDPVHESGMKIAAQIERDMIELGRTRKEATVRSGAQKDSTDSCALKDSCTPKDSCAQEEAAKVATSAEGRAKSHHKLT